MIVDADAEVGKILRRHHHHRRRLPSAPVAAGGLAVLERGQHAFGKREATSALKPASVAAATRSLLSMLPATLTPRFADAAAPLDAMFSGPGGEATVAIDGMDLADFAALVARDRRPDRELRRQSARQPVEHDRRQIAIGERLRSDRADAGAHERHERSRRKRLGRDGRAERAGLLIERDDGPGHGRLRCWRPRAEHFAIRDDDTVVLHL